jgi:beta-lactamase regulating signal transducer with metallopeptidase domain
MFEPLLQHPLAQAIGWALLHFVWQGALVAVLTALALAALRRSAADVRYVVASIGLALMLTLPVVTAVQRWRTETPGQPPAAATMDAARMRAAPSATSVQANPAIDGPPLDVRTPPEYPGTRAFAPAAWTSVLVPMRADIVAALFVVWILGVTVLSMRLLTGWLWVQRMRTHATVPAREAWQQMAHRIGRKLHLYRVVALLESTAVDVPTVVGWMKPVVLLPASALGGLSPAQIEAILAHELAHIRRHDYLVNLLQTLVETLLFYHPAVWWVSHRIRVERENCCDDLAVSLCGDPVGYAHALADLEAFRASRFALAATGGSLLDRVRRLVGAPPSHAGRGPAWLAGIAALVLLGGMATAAEAARQSAATATAVTTVAPSSTAPSRSANTSVTSEDVGQTTAVPPRPPRPPEAPQPPEPPTQPAPAAQGAPAPPAPPAAPQPPAAPAAPQPGEQTVSINTHESSGNWIWSNNGEKLAIDYNGTFELTDDDADVKSLSPGGHLKISDAALLGRHTVEINERGGQLQRRYYVNGVERPYDPEGREWLKTVLPRFVRNSGIGADKRVARILKNGGTPAVLAEIGRIDSSYVKGIYFKQLVLQASLTPDQYRDVMLQAGRDLKSDYELATFLISVADRMPTDEASRSAYFTAAGNLKSSYELHRVYSTMLKKGQVNSSVLAGILEHTSAITSDYDESEVLLDVIATQHLDDRTRPLFFKALENLNGDYERHRVLSAVLKTGDRTAIGPALAAAGSINSDYEAATLLIEMLSLAPPEGSLRDPFFKAVNGLTSSSYEMGRVLTTLVSRTDVSHDTLLAALHSAKSLNSSYECSQVLVAAANTHALTGDLGDAYIDVATRLGTYEQGQAMAALVKSERRKN